MNVLFAMLVSFIISFCFWRILFSESCQEDLEKILAYGFNTFLLYNFISLYKNININNYLIEFIYLVIIPLLTFYLEKRLR